MLSVDPGLTGTGVVYWRIGYPRASTVIHPKGDDLIDRAFSISMQIATFYYISIGKFPAGRTCMVIEYPEYQEGLRGQVSSQTGSIIKLAFLIGILVGASSSGWEPFLVAVRDWKGQLPKQVITNRMIKYYGQQCKLIGIKTHAWDALGLGHWAMQQEWMR